MSLKRLLRRLVFTPKVVGGLGEARIASKLDMVNLLGKCGKTLQNIYVPLNNGKTTEIDLLYITQKGLFVIESKNYSGYIFGDENNRNWTSTLSAGKRGVEKHQFYNPIWQNNAHISALKQYLGMNLPTFSLIVFSDRCELKNVSVFSPEIYICKQNKLFYLVRTLWDSSLDVLDEHQITTIYCKLLPLTTVNNSVKMNHIVDVQSKQFRTELCPRCGRSLVLRTAKQGANAGQQFFGCSGFPNCRFTKNLP